MMPESTKGWGVMFLSFLCVLLFHYFWSNRKNSLLIEEPVPFIGGSYEMQRVKNDFVKRFDLSDRIVNYKKITNKKPGAAVAFHGPQILKNIPVKLLKKPVKAAAKTKKDGKENALGPNGETPEEQAAIANPNNIQPTELSDGKGPGGPPAEAPPGAPPPLINNNKKTAAAAAPGEQLTESQWISVLSSNPTAAEIQNFLAAKKNLGVTTYYAVISNLLSNNSTTVQQTGEKILTADNSATTFEYLSDMSGSVKANGNVSTFVSTTLQNYGSSAGEFNVLSQVLVSQDPASIINAENLILADAKKASSVSASGSTGTGQVSTFSYSQFTVFKKPLTSLETSSNPQISSLAKAVVTQLWSSGTLASQNGNGSEDRPYRY